jgi:Trypsin-like peptidase domain
MLSGPGSGNPVPSETGSALGSGFIIGADGLIVTNRHVIEGARTVRVKLADGREVPAQVIGADATTDIALLRVSAGGLSALRLESSDKISVGDPVIAIGNPFGLGQTVTAGILSARPRTLERGPYIDFLQTDAAVSFNKPLHLLQLIAALLQETSPAARLWQDKSISSQLTQQASRYATGQRCIRATSHDRPAGFWPLNICRCLARRSEPGPP